MLNANILKTHTPEILAPAGSFESLVAAVRCGANAVYVGSREFSARASAQNFNNDELKKAVEFCHQRDVKLHLAVNTAVYDSEIDAVKRLITNAAQIGVDALIVSDLGVLSLCREICPELEIHASTQMGIASPLGAEFAASLGFKRAVLSRELSFNEIKEICNKNVIDTEVFVHGAMCMCVSGQCYMSSVLGGRSGNRGRCAQPCRLEFNAAGKGNHHLSLKDMSLCDHLNKLSDIGVNSFKIEGRMKRPEYVAAAVSLVKASLEGTEKEEILSLSRDIFSRSGFTDGYLLCKNDKSMFGFRSKDDSQNTASAIKKIHQSFRREYNSVPLSAEITLIENKRAELCFTDKNQNCVSVLGDEVLKAETPRNNEDVIREKVSRLGDTPFYLENLKINTTQNALVSPSVINDLRRKATQKLLEKRAQPIKREIFEVQELKSAKKTKTKQKIIARFETLEQLENADIPLFDEAVISADVILKHNEKIKALNVVYIAELWRHAFSNDDNLKKSLSALKQIGVNKVVCQNYSQVKIAQNMGFEIMLGAFMNTVNSCALNKLSQTGVSSAVASFELSSKSIKRLNSPVDLGALVYGYLPLMITRACPIKNVSDCNECKKRPRFLTDRMGKRFRLVCRDGIREIYNTVPLVFDFKSQDFENLDFLYLHFTFEDVLEVNKILKGINNKSLEFIENKTRGLYKTGAL
ncbi:MAG: U32 family peptidase [Oscillospiraceae bacterium]|nr:U32 family peptidase [Oscillospiraceae bacterium]